jgi:hypothetical protein
LSELKVHHHFQTAGGRCDSEGSSTYPHSVTAADFHCKPNVCKIRFTVRGYKVMKGKWYLESISSFFYTIEQTAIVCYGKLKVVARLNGVAARLWTCNKRITEKESIDNRLRVDLLVLYTTKAASPNSFHHVSTVQGHFQDLLIFGDCILSIITTNSTCT